MAYLDQRAQLAKMQDDANDMLNADQDEYVDALNDKYQEFLERVIADAQALRSNIAENSGGPVPSYSDYLRFQGDDKLARMVARELAGLNQYVDTDLLDQLEDTYRTSYNLNAWTLDESTPPNLDIEYKMPPDLVLRQLVSTSWTGNMFSQNIGAINDMMARDIQNAVAQAMLSGDSADNLAQRLRSVIGDGSSDYSYRAKMIARTELLRSANLARQHVLEQNSDLVEDWIWVTRSLASGRLCEDCMERAGKTKSEVEEIAEEQELWVNPPCHPNCGCTWMPQVKSWQELLPPEAQAYAKENAIGGSNGPFTMVAVDTEAQTASKVTPLNYADWADRYLSETEQ